MKYCENQNCKCEIPNWSIVEDKKVNTQRRRFCLLCSPYKSHNTRDINIPKLSKSEKRKNGSKNVIEWRKNFKKRIVASLGGKCQCCGYNKCSDALETHHLNPDEKEMSFGGIRGHPRAWERVIVELRKCVLLCCLCHREVHAKIRAIPDNVQKFDERWVDYKKIEKLATQIGVEPISDF